MSLGIDGILVSNHGGRQIEALPAPIDCVPAVVKAVGSKRPRSCSTPACAAAPTWRGRWRSAPMRRFAGKAFLWSLGALGAEGPGHAIDLFIDELQSALGQIGAHSPAEARRTSCSAIPGHTTSGEIIPDLRLAALAHRQGAR